MSATNKLVSILIPTYNRPDYFEAALKSALAQTWQNIEIVVTDDSTTDDTEALVVNYQSKYDNIRYVRNRPGLGAARNFRKCMSLARGEYINYLMDDDLFHPEKIERMMAIVAADPDVTIVTSPRAMIDKSSAIGAQIASLSSFLQRDAILPGKAIANICLRDVFNYIGEPTTVLFRADSLDEPYGVFAGRAYGCNADMASWIPLMCKGKLGYVHATLSYLRVHEGQQSHELSMHLLGIADWLHQIQAARQFGLLKDDGDYITAVGRAGNLMITSTRGIANHHGGKIAIESEVLPLFTSLWNQHCMRFAEPAATPSPVVGEAPELLERVAFDESAYLVANPDVAIAMANGIFADAYTHYVTHGHQERRKLG
ncbi:glycosyltransferase family 2 protein [Paraburkholderia ferrariae]|uniref:glycosyltransferase family 2 protein n=1 Tax=Paraburkholderia ferrariae TaxID=386056 RepID=UPI000693CE01|nr:glycosyltransferase family 2 protein [Paraburkholderia ferrariae]